jgi:RNA polymerase sigma-70 factor (ECF subfamily)
MDDLGVVGRLVAGDAAAWDRFLREFGPVLVRAAASVLGRAAGERGRRDAEEVAQKVVALLVDHDARLLRSFQGRSTLSTWLVGIVRRQAFLHLRAQRIAEAKAPDPAPPPPTPPELAEIAESEAELRAALDALAPRERLLLTLHYFDAAPHARIARLLGVSLNSVSPLLDRARERLREVLAVGRKKRT